MTNFMFLVYPFSLALTVIACLIWAFPSLAQIGSIDRRQSQVASETLGTRRTQNFEQCMVKYSLQLFNLVAET